MFPVMPDAQVIEWIREKYTALIADLDERARRRWGAAEARSLGWGGIQAVAAATGLSDRTIRNGIKELDDPKFKFRVFRRVFPACRQLIF